ncbi:MAG: tRNA pseudouridine(38-40) synthase TruA [Planctomycetota bacterium]
MPTQRYKLTLAYDGSAFHGWQRQPQKDGTELRTVQQEVQRAVREVVRPASGKIHVLGASRTDSGVHAFGQCAQFDADTPVPPDRMARAIAGRLPDDIDILQCEPVSNDFNVIGDVVSKQYRYRIFTDPRKPLAIRHLVYPGYEPMDLPFMRDAARDLVGEHDFAAFTKAGHGRDSTVRTIHHCVVEPHDLPTGPELHIVVSGSGFLYNMVRIIAGTLVDIGRGRLRYDTVRHCFHTNDRRNAGPTLPPQGLALEWIKYKHDAEGQT